jgi:flagellar biosynthesis protein FliR
MYPPAGDLQPVPESVMHSAIGTMATTFRLAWGIAVPLVLAQWIVQLVMAAAARMSPVWNQLVQM